MKILFKIFLCGFLLLGSRVIVCIKEETTDMFDSISKIVEYAKLVSEYPKPDNKDWENPSYSSYHAALLGLKWKDYSKFRAMNNLWTANGFKILLHNVIQTRETNGFKGRLVIKLYPIPGTQFIIFGEMHGAFHSLARDLQALLKLGYINEHLKIVKPDCYLVFNGNISSRSPYVMETMSVILQLMNVNPNNIIVICGNQEEKERWTNYTLKDELEQRAMHLEYGKGTLSSMITQFFDTLPLAVYLIGLQSEKNVDIVRISNVGTESKDLSEKEFADFFLHPEISVGNIDEGIYKKAAIDINLKALIRGEQFFRSQYIPSTGLQLSGKEEGATGWVVMSSPTQAYQKLFQFYYDAFAILTTQLRLNDWTLALLNRDVRESEPLQQTKVYKLISGSELSMKQIMQSQLQASQEKVAYLKDSISLLDKALKEGRPVPVKINVALLSKEQKDAKQSDQKPLASSHEISKMQSVQTGIRFGKDPAFFTVGTLVDLSSNTKEEGESIVLGIRTVFDRINRQGGIGGKQLRLEVKDTRYSKEYGRQGAESLIKEDQIGLILCPLSTGPLEGCLDLLQKKELLALFPLASGVTAIRNPDLSTLFFIRASTIQEGYIITKYVLEDLKAKNIAFFYENDTFGLDTLRGAQQALKELGVEDFLAISYEPYNLNIADQVAILKKSKVDALGCFGMQAVVKELYAQLGSQWLVNKKLFGSMDLSMLSFRKYCDRNGFQFVSTSVVPDPEKGNLEIVKEYRRAIESTSPSNDIHCLEAYIGADFFVHILQQIDQPITAEKIMAFLTNLKNYHYKGLDFTFNSETRQLMHTLWLNKGNSDWQALSTLSLEKNLSARQTDTKVTIESQARKITDQKQITTVIQEKNAEPSAKEPAILLESVHTKSQAIIAEPVSVEKKGSRILTIGSTMDLSRGAKDLSQAVKNGIELAFDTEQIADLSIKFIVLDDAYMPNRALDNVEKLLGTHHADFLLSTVGSPTFVAFKHLIKNGVTADIFPIPGISYVRTPESTMKYCIHFRPSYVDEAYVLTQHILKTKEPHEFIAFYQDDEFGLACMLGVKKALSASSIKVTELPYARNDMNFDTQVKTIKDSSARYIALFATPLAARQFLEQLGDETVRRCTFFGVSDLGGNTFRKMVVTKGISIIMTHVVPDPLTSTIPLIEGFRVKAKNAAIVLDSFALEGYISGMIIIDVLHHLGSNISKDSIVQYLERIKNYKLDGYILNFDEQKRQLSNKIWIDDGKGPWVEETMSAA
jgi:ABC-type branched-subunit amino acid transport system substrate-binding protein